MTRDTTRIWTAEDGRLVFEIVFDRDWRPGDAAPPAIALVRVVGRPDLTREVAIQQGYPTWFEIDFPTGYRVQGMLEQRAPVHIDDVTCRTVFADVHCTPPNGQDFHFEGVMVSCPIDYPCPPPFPPDPPFPPFPPEPTPPSPWDPGGGADPLPILAATDEALFPYVYVRRWPRVTGEATTYGFASYPIASPPAGFVADLIAARADRVAAETCAIAFIEGQPPYAGLFVDSVARLPGPLCDFPRIAEALHGRIGGSDMAHDVWLARLVTMVEECLEAYGQDTQYLVGPDYLGQVDRLWQSYFALVVTLGYDQRLLAEIALALWLTHAVALTMTPAAGSGGGVPTARQIGLLADATLVLPAAIFPLAPAAASPPSGGGSLAPYAVGDLQMVRQRLLRYAPGEIARIENVMRGERRETSSRRLRQQHDTVDHRTSDVQTSEQDGSERRSSLAEEAFRAASDLLVTQTYDNFATSYGPPTVATLNGTWTRAETQGGNPGSEASTRFARDVLDHTVTRIGRTVGALRRSSTLSQTEELVSSVIDNTRGTTDIRAVFRWVNQVYEACVVNYGNRLMLEFFVSNPASGFAARQQVRSTTIVVEPLSPAAQFGVHSFADISRGNYGDVCAAYGVTELVPPPDDRVFVTLALRAGEERQLAIPAGYQATNAFVGCVVTPSGLTPPEVIVGRLPVTPGVTAAPLAPYGETATIPVSVAALPALFLPPSVLPVPPAPATSPPAPTPTPTPTSTPPAPSAPTAEALVNVEVQCEPTARAMDAWRIGIYAAVTRAYLARLADYHARAGDVRTIAAVPRAPLACRRIEQQTLKAACLRILIDQLDGLTGAVGSPPGDPALPRQVQFLDAALEWREMAYTFQGKDERDDLDAIAGDGDDGFVAFLEADQARVLLPVAPGRLMTMLYALSSGMIWDGPDSLAPADSGDVPLIDDLKRRPRGGRHDVRVGPSWEVVVPTAMQMLAGRETDPRSACHPILEGSPS